VVLMTDDNRIVVLAGAGLCRDAGLPMSVELVTRLQDTLNARSQIAEGGIPAAKDRDQARRWLALFHFLNGGIRFQEGVLDRDPGAPINIEQIAVAAEELYARMSNPLAPYSAGWHPRLEELEQQDVNLLKSFVDFIYSRLQEWLSIENPQTAYYMEGFRDLCIDGHFVDLFTLNYDLCIETVLSHARTPFVNGFDERGVWSPASYNLSTEIRLYKLHGSLDWADDEVYGLCSLQFPRHQSAETIQGDDARPLLIFGTAHKLSAKEPFLTLAYHFSQQVLTTKILAVIGYSFGDEYINQIIEQGMKRNSNLRVIVVSPSAVASIRTQPFLDRSPRVIPICESAEHALTKKALRDQIRKVLADVSSEAPFSDE